MRVIRLALAALFAVTAFSAMAASSASAWHPLFLTLSGKELHFIGLAPNPALRGENLGQVGIILCEHVVVLGWILSKSPLIHRVHLSFLGKCEQHLNGVLTPCTEPILPKLALGEIGLLLLPDGTHHVAIKLEPDDGTGVFTTVKCGNNNTEVTGSIVGELPGPYNVPVASTEARFESIGKNSVHQKYTVIDLLGVKMEFEELKVAGFFGGPAAEDANATLTPNGPVEICTREPQNCP